MAEEKEETIKLDELRQEEVESEALEIAQAEADIRKDYLETEYEDIGVVRIYHPNFQEEGDINEYYSTVYNKLLVDNKELPTHTQLKEILEERGSWTSKHEDLIASYKDQLQDAYTEISKLNSKKNKNNKKTIEKQKRAFQDKIGKIISQWEQLATSKLQMFRGTVESWADDRTLKYKIYICVRDEEDKLKWESAEEVGNLRGSGMRRLMNDAVKFWSGMSDPLFADSLGLMYGNSDTEQQ